MRNFAKRSSLLFLFGKERYYIKKVDPEKIAFTWDPKKTKRARKLKPLKDITTYHTYGYYRMFKPSIAEVLAQIPEGLLAATIAFEIVERPETAADLDKHSEALNDGYHVATTRLYAKA